MSEITHLVCAHCGTDSAVSNDPESFEAKNSPLSLNPMNVLVFTCGYCKAVYPLFSSKPIGGDDGERAQYDALMDKDEAYTTRMNTISFSPGKTITVVMEVKDRFASKALMASLYSNPNNPTLACGSVVTSISFEDLFAKLENMKRDVSLVVSGDLTFNRPT